MLTLPTQCYSSHFFAEQDNAREETHRQTVAIVVGWRLLLEIVESCLTSISPLSTISQARSDTHVI